MEAAKHILRYLKGTSHVGLTYSKQPAKLANILLGMWMLTTPQTQMTGRVLAVMF
jgi:hypothetical protein